VVAPYGLTRETVDGNDVVAVWEHFGRFLAEARAGRGPLLLECLTYRLRGHYEGDPTYYRKALEAEDWQEKDPILRLQRLGIAEGWFVEDDATTIEREASKAVDAAVEFARASPFPATGVVDDLTYA
jgi:TPP-dependent pyruvate/acetoin dehydrogenase alpha subunit